MAEDLIERAIVDVLQWEPAERRFLVCVRAGAHSLHLDWFDPQRPRRWDLLLSYYAAPETGPDFRADMVVAGGLSKFAAIDELLRATPMALDGYGAVLFLDDDVALEFTQLDRLFWLFSRYGLDLAQPALDHCSHASWPVTLHCPSFRMRFTNFVEIMMPVFSRAGLRRCLPTFGASISGYGLDFVWAAMLGCDANRIGIIDDVVVSHTRPIDRADGAFYRHLRSLGVDAGAEWDALMRRFGVAVADPHVTGGILRLKEEASGGWSSFRELSLMRLKS